MKTPYNLNCQHDIVYFSGEEDFSDLLASVRLYVQGNSHRQVVNLSTNLGEDGYSATLIVL